MVKNNVTFTDIINFLVVGVYLTVVMFLLLVTRRLDPGVSVVGWTRRQIGAKIRRLGQIISGGQ